MDINCLQYGAEMRHVDTELESRIRKIGIELTVLADAVGDLVRTLEARRSLTLVPVDESLRVRNDSGSILRVGEPEEVE